MSMNDVTGASGTPPPGFMSMMGDTVGLPGLLASGGLATSKILPLIARYGASAGGALAGGPLTAAITAMQALRPTPAEGGGPLYVKDASGRWVPNRANPTVQEAIAKNPQLAGTWQASGANGAMSPMPGSEPFPLQPNGMNPTGQAPLPSAPLAPAPTPTTAPMTQAMSAQAQQPVPLPTPRPNIPPPQAQAPAIAPPAPGPTAPPPNLYNGPGSQNFGQGGVAGGAQPSVPGAIPNGANITSALQKLMSGNGGSMFQPQTAAASQSNPAGNILPFTKNLLQSGSSSNQQVGLNSALPSERWYPSNAWYNN